MPDVTKETKIPSMLVWSSAVLRKADVKSPPLMLSKALAGKLVSDVHLYHARLKLVPLDVSINGKLVSDVHLYHAAKKSVPLEVSINGKLVSDEQPRHA